MRRIVKRAIKHNPDWPGGYIWLAAIYGQRGPLEKAGRMFAEMLRQTPNFSIETRRQLFAYRDRSIADWMIGGLRKASANARRGGFRTNPIDERGHHWPECPRCMDAGSPKHDFAEGD